MIYIYTCVYIYIFQSSLYIYTYFRKRKLIGHHTERSKESQNADSGLARVITEMEDCQGGLTQQNFWVGRRKKQLKNTEKKIKKNE